MPRFDQHDVKGRHVEELRRKLINRPANDLAEHPTSDETSHRLSCQPKDRKGNHPYKTGSPRRARSDAVARNHTVSVGTLVEIQANEHGHLDEEHLEALVVRLLNLADNKHRGDVLLDLSAIRSVTSHFMQVFESFRSVLSDQQRRVVLYGTHTQFRNLHVSDLGRLVEWEDQSAP